MKNLYTLTILLILFVGRLTFGQSSAALNLTDQPTLTTVNQRRIVPFIGISIAIPLFKKSNKDRQQRKLLELLSAPLPAPVQTQTDGILAKPGDPKQDRPDNPPAGTNEAGPIAWSTTGQEVTLYVRGSRGGAGGAAGAGGGSGGGEGQYNYTPDVPEDGTQPGNGGATDGTGYEPPRPIMNARKVPKNYCENGKTVFKNMWDRQADVNKEQVAFVTDKGIFWLSDSESTRTSAKTGFGYEYGGDPGGKSFIVDNVVYIIKAIIHAHPDYKDLSEEDMVLAKNFGVPIFAIAPDGISKGTPNGSRSVADNNKEDAFDCATANGVLGI